MVYELNKLRKDASGCYLGFICLKCIFEMTLCVLQTLYLSWRRVYSFCKLFLLTLTLVYVSALKIYSTSLPRTLKLIRFLKNVYTKGDALDMTHFSKFTFLSFDLIRLDYIYKVQISSDFYYHKLTPMSKWQR